MTRQVRSAYWRGGLKWLSFAGASLIGVFTPAVVGAQNHPILDVRGFQQNRDYFSEAPFEHIDTLSGNLVLTFTDLVLPGNAGRELRFQRTYNSKNTRWTFGLADVPLYVAEPAVPVVPPDPQQLTPALHMADGSVRKLAWASQPNFSVPSTLEVTISSDFWRYDRSTRTLSIPDGRTCVYAENSADPPPLGLLRLDHCGDPFGNNLTVAWAVSPDPPGLVVTQYLSSTDSRTVAIELDSSGFPTTMEYDGRIWTYTATSVEPPTGAAWSYTYDGLELESATTPHGGVITYAYDDEEYEGPDSPQVQYFTRVVRSRVTSGALPAGQWDYTYQISGDGTSGITTVDTPSARILYTHGGTTAAYYAVVFDGNAGVVPLTERQVQEWNGSVWVTLEREQLDYDMVPVVNWTSFGTLEIDTRTVTRHAGGGSTQYVTTYAYDSASFGDYHHPETVTEVGDAGTRITTFTYQHLSTPFVVGLLATEQAVVGSEAFAKAWTNDTATGFRTSETVYGVTTTFTADTHGNIASVLRENGKQTAYTHEWGLLKDVITAAHTTTRVINPEGTVASQTHGGRTTSFQYDDLFRITQVNPPGGTNPIVTEYDVDGEWVRVTRGASVVTTTLDGLGRPTSTVSSVGVRTSTAYDADGRVVYEGYPYIFGVGSGDIGTTLTYDALGRVTRQANPDSTYRERVYGLGIVTEADENAHAMVQVFEAFGDPNAARLVAVTDTDLQSWLYAYNGLGKLVSVTAPDSTTRIWSYYAGSDRLHEETHPESGTTTYAYSDAGMLTVKTDSNGATFSYFYDGNDRLASVAAGDRTTAITYEAGTDNRKTASAGAVFTEYQYDGAGRRSGRRDIVDGRAFQTGFEYDGNDRVSAIEYPSATGSSRRRVAMTHDSGGRITRVYEGSHDYAHTFSYHPSGAVLAYTSGNGVVNTFTFDVQRYWPTSITASGWSMGYQDYDAVGNAGTVTDSRSGYGQTLNYDALDRLTGATGVYGSATYVYDPHGNRQTANGTTYAYQSGTLRLSQQGGISFSYDNNGNMTSAGTTTFTYTPDNVVATASGIGITATYTYDADQWRLKKTDQSVPTYQLRGVDGALLTEWRSAAASVHVEDYIYSGSRLIAAISRDVTEPTPSIACPATTDLVSMDFESGGSLSSFGFGWSADLSNQSGAGLRGTTWGLRGNSGASASDKYYAEALLPVSHTGRAFRLEADFDHADAGENEYGYSAFELRGGALPWPSYFLSLYHGLGAARDRLNLDLPYDDGPWPTWESGPGVIVPGATQRITVCGTLSTVDDWEGEINPDGTVLIYVDNVLQFASAGHRIANIAGNGTVSQVMIGPMGRFDNFKVGQE